MTRKPAKADQRSLSATLITFAGGLICVALFAAGNFVDKVARVPLMWGFALGSLGVILLTASIIAGGVGTSRGITPGPGNAFDRQAKLGGLGLLLLLLAAGVLTLGHRTEDPLITQVNTLQGRISGLENQVAGTRSDIAMLKQHIVELSSQRAQVPAKPATPTQGNPIPSQHSNDPVKKQ